MIRIFIKVTLFLHLPNTFSFFYCCFACYLMKYIHISSAVIVLVVILILCLPLFFSQFHEIVLVKSFYFMVSLLIYNLTSIPTH